MTDERQPKHGVIRSFVLGGVVGASAVAAGIRRARRRRLVARRAPLGLAAFEGAPCYRELLDAEAEGQRDAS
jgi:hypothetical protein